MRVMVEVRRDVLEHSVAKDALQRALVGGGLDRADDLLDATAEGYIDDYHFMAPTGTLELQVMYLAITNGTAVPLGAAAILLNP